MYSSNPIFVVNDKKASNLRLNTIHVRGVQELSSDEVLKYFEMYDPASLEWVNDLTCNVVFDDPKAAATAMIGLMSGFVNARKDEVSEDKYPSGITIIDPSTLEVPVPPEYWILGEPHPKSKALLLRIATVNDKKIHGAGKYSEFYRKHGNPHYGGQKNLISKSLAEKLAKYPRALEEGLPVDDDLSFEIEEEEPLRYPPTRKLRMKMRADEEEEAKSQNILISIPNDDAMDLLDEELEEVDIDREVFVESKKKSIWQRLGPQRNDPREREWGLSTRSREIGRSSHLDRASVFSRLSFGPSESRDRSSYKPPKSRSIVRSNLRIKK